MGPITGLATIATVLTVVLVVAGLAVVGLTLGVVVPSLRATRPEHAATGSDRRRFTPAPHPAH